jgi:hypothetical protein
VEESFRPAHEGAQAAVRRSVTRESHDRTELFVATAADRADAARIGRIERDPCSAPRPVGDDRRDLVTEHERSVETRLADRPVGIPVEVGAAQPDREDPQEDFGRPGRRDGLLVDPDVAGRVEAGDGLH